MSVGNLIQSYAKRGATFALNDNGEVCVTGPKLTDDDKSKLRSIKGEIAAYLVSVAPGNKMASLPIDDDPESWRVKYVERTEARQFAGLYPRPKAEALAFGDVVNQWHVQHVKPLQGECAGCRKQLERGDEAIRLRDGAEVHLICVRAYGLRWRKRASEALAGMGVKIPSGWTV